MKNTIKRKLSILKLLSYKVTLVGSLSMVLVSEALAALPTMEAASRGSTSDGIYTQAKNYGYDAVMLAALFVAAIAFLKVAGALIEGFSEVSAGKKKMGDLGGLAVVGVILLIAIIWILGKATGILE